MDLQTLGLQIESFIRIFILFIVSVLLCSQNINAQKSKDTTSKMYLIHGIVKDEKTKENLYYVSVELMKGDSVAGKTFTDTGGCFSLEVNAKQSEMNKYYINIYYLGYYNVSTQKNIFSANTIVILLAAVGKFDFGGDVFYPMINIDDTKSGQDFDANQIKHSPYR